MKYNIKTLAITLVIAMTACVSKELELRTTTGQLTVTATHISSKLPSTKTTLTPSTDGIHVAWAENDKIRIMQANANTYTAVDLLLQEGAGSQTATFKGNAFPDVPGAANLKYQAFYPTTIEGNTPEAWKKKATYKGQIQQGNNNTEHLAAFDYIATKQIDNLAQPLEFMHLGVIFCFDITLPNAAKSIPQSLALTTVNNKNIPIIEGGLFEDCNQTKTSSLTLNFQNGTTTTSTFKAYMMCNCNIPAMQKVLVTLTLQNGSTYTSLLTASQVISSLQSNAGNGGSCYIIPVSEWEETKNSIFNAQTQAKKYRGSGTSTDPYVIESAENLKYMAESSSNFENRYISLETDITIEDGTVWTPIGNYSSATSPSPTFSGHFNGNGHSIKGSLKESNDQNILGFFGETQNAYISNLNVYLNITNDTCQYVGGIIGKASNTKISNCHFNGNICAGTVTTPNTIGGIIAQIKESCKVDNCSCRGSVKQNSKISQNAIYIGGIIGNAYYQDSILQCRNYAEVRCNKTNDKSAETIGGIIGKTYPYQYAVLIEECYNYGNIYGASAIKFKPAIYCNLGGIIGRSSSCRFTKVYNYGSIHIQQSQNRNNVGGIIGYIDNEHGVNSLNNCANYGEIIGNANSQVENYAGGFIGYISNTNCEIHQCHSAGNISIETDSQENSNIIVGSYISFIEDRANCVVYKCCSTAPDIIIKNAKGETILASQPNFYIGSGQALNECPDNHPTLNN